MNKIILGSDGKNRCKWSDAAPDFLDYHDHEWGFPVSDEKRLFEKICLEGFQSGLTWRTILGKRENFRQAFHDFDYNKISKFREDDIETLLQNSGIVRHRGKIEAVINNAKRAQDLVQEFGSLAAYFWQHEPSSEQLSAPQTASTSPHSITLSKDLKKRGWKFIGPTTVFAFMQAMGLINDHVEACFVHQTVEQERQKFKRPC